MVQPRYRSEGRKPFNVGEMFRLQGLEARVGWIGQFENNPDLGDAKTCAKTTEMCHTISFNAWDLPWISPHSLGPLSVDVSMRTVSNLVESLRPDLALDRRRTWTTSSVSSASVRPCRSWIHILTFWKTGTRLKSKLKWEIVFWSSDRDACGFA